MKRVFALLVVSLVPVLSCGGTSELPSESVVAASPAENSPAEVAAFSEGDSEKELAVPTLPAGTFRDVHALCALQMKEIEPQLEKARRYEAERQGDGDISRSVPACDEDPAAMRGVRVTLAAPYVDAKAVTYETGFATQTSIIVRTSDGWTNLGVPLVASYHDDPGCASILRDAGLMEVRVENGYVVVVDKADRGAGDENALVYERARTCSLTACTEPVTIGTRIVRWDGKGKGKRLFSTTYTVDGEGTIVPAHAWDDETPYETP
jgi:hypothetical protein